MVPYPRSRPLTEKSHKIIKSIEISARTRRINERSIHPCNSTILRQEGLTKKWTKRRTGRRIDIRTTNSEETRGRIRRVTYLSRSIMVCCLHDGDNNDGDNDGDGNSNDNTHLGRNILSR